MVSSSRRERTGSRHSLPEFSFATKGRDWRFRGLLGRFVCGAAAILHSVSICPGLGDSDGDISSDLLDFINSGGYAAIAASSVKELVKRIGLSGVVIVGHCAGSVSALFAAAATIKCKGLILMDPYFHLPQMKQSDGTPAIKRHGLGKQSWRRPQAILRSLEDYAPVLARRKRLQETQISRF